MTPQARCIREVVDLGFRVSKKQESTWTIQESPLAEWVGWSQVNEAINGPTINFWVLVILGPPLPCQLLTWTRLCGFQVHLQSTITISLLVCPGSVYPPLPFHHHSVIHSFPATFSPPQMLGLTCQSKRAIGMVCESECVPKATTWR